MSQRSRKKRKRSLWSIFFGSDSAGQRITGTKALSVGSGDVKPKKSIKERWKYLKKRLKAAKAVEFNDSRKTQKKSFSLKNLRKTFAAASFQENSNSTRRKKQSRFQKQFQLFITNLPQIILLFPVIFSCLWLLVLSISLNSEKPIQTSQYTEKFETAIANGTLNEAEILLKKQAEVDSKSINNLLLNLAKLDSLTGKKTLQDQIYYVLAADPASIYGEAILHITKKQMREFQQSDEMKLTIERQLLKAMADKRAESSCRIELGRFYRINRRLNDAARILEPVKTTENGALELALTKLGQKQFSEIKPLIIPFIENWRGIIEKDADNENYRNAAFGVIIFGEEQRMIEIVDNSKNTITPELREEIALFGFQTWMQRLLRDGQRTHTQILTIINKNQPARPCSTIWFSPLIQIANSDSPLKLDAANLLKKLIENQSCQASDLIQFCIELKSLGRMELASTIARRIHEKYQNEKETLLQLALEFDRVEPVNPQLAIEILNRCIANHPDFINARELRAEFKIRDNQFGEAIPDLLATLPFNVIYPEFHLKLANCYQKIGDQPNAILHETLANDLSLSTQKPTKSTKK